ncbi:hypothetical protein Q3V23_19030 [Streptomyces sp. VNUA116]|uniref:hypothetical protein n=1 Tax=Streptomyces sp. VNUA116 TaxID=3062449 RepID=UPI0026772476|nr:hypothetical protein [Streptomyces sp. VNUA116]WKU45984.1 hypothetical protein Q3V23_19030 [Streptomyces sp. VNUA116]
MSTEPTVAELRADLAERINDLPPGLSANALRGVLDLLDDWQKERAEQATYTRKAARGATTPKTQQRSIAEILAAGGGGKYAGTATAGFAAGAALDRLRAAGRARRQWETRYKPYMAEIIYNARHVARVPAPEIAEELEVTEGYVYRVLRENTEYEYRLDVRDGAPGPGWQPFESGDAVASIAQPELLAELVLNEYLAAHPEHADPEGEPRLRVLLWVEAPPEEQGKAQPDDKAVRTVLWPDPEGQ